MVAPNESVVEGLPENSNKISAVRWEGTDAQTYRTAAKAKSLFIFLNFTYEGSESVAGSGIPVR